MDGNVLPPIQDSQLPPGAYAFPRLRKDESLSCLDFQKRLARGPRGVLEIYDFPNISAILFGTYVYFFVTSVVVTHLSSAAISGNPQGDILWWRVFYFASLTGVLAHSSGAVLQGLWFHHRLLAASIEGLSYGFTSGFVLTLFHLTGWNLGASN
ncbi:MAG TPA: hypothetical protein PKA83_04580 [Pirellulaceae bacterium]|nr:hypothetical protein [Pirellulaceae bacterium]